MEHEERMHSFLLVGQSNMLGRGYFRDALRVDMSHIKVLKDGNWQQLAYPADPEKKLRGVCLSERFAERYAEDFGVEVGLISCAVGGTCIDQWCVGGTLFENACQQAELAKKTSTIAGILWHQGESDCEDDRYPIYGKKLEVVLDTLRKRLNLTEVPLIVGGLGDYLGSMNPLPRYQNYVYINGAIRQYASSRWLTEFVSSQGLQPDSDNLHFNSPSLYELGNRYYEAFLKCLFVQKEKDALP